MVGSGGGGGGGGGDCEFGDALLPPLSASVAIVAVVAAVVQTTFSSQSQLPSSTLYNVPKAHSKIRVLSDVLVVPSSAPAHAM